MTPGLSVADHESLSQRAARSLRHPLTRTLLALTFSTGLIDAACYLGLGRVFTANMTGNILLLGLGVAGSGGLPVLGPIVSLGAFLVGAGAGGMLAVRLADHHAEHFARALEIEGALLAAGALVAIAVHVRPGALSAYVVIALLALAMGVRNATVRRIAVPDLTTTVLTMTLTSLAAELPLFGGTGKGTARKITAVLAMGIGAAAGALLLRQSLVLPLAAAAALALVGRLLYVPWARRDLLAHPA
jgi:uncharacterized membrane protein YoaK (UPF0700 family)